jgi:hypothetical protein
MAFRDLSITHELLPTGLYNVTKAVGKNSANRRDDVLLVQFLLKKFYALTPRLTPPTSGIAVDGLFGPTTGRWIAQFQLHANQEGVPMAMDGVVDRAKRDVESSISRTIYAIVTLNATIRTRDEVFFESLPVNPEAPAELRGVLLRTRAA